MEDKNLKIIHIVPAAFDYFENIKEQALSLAYSQRESGFYVEVSALQYGLNSRKEKEEIKKNFPNMELSGFFNIDEVINNLDNFDIIHIHAPFLGVGKVWQWLKIHPKAKICLTYYQTIEKNDLFAWFIVLYNAIYLPKFFKRANLIIMDDKEKFIESFGKKYFNQDFPVVDLLEASHEVVRENNIHLTKNVQGVKLTMEESRILAYFNFYNFLMK